MHAQCPVADFSAPLQVCLEENFIVSNQSTGGDLYEWDFTSGDLKSAPAVQDLLVVNGASVPIGLQIIRDENEWFGFIISQTNNSLIRLDFGNSIESLPSVTNLGNVGNLLNGAHSLKLIKYNTNWVGLITNFSGSNLITIDFGNSLRNIPVANDLGDLGVINQPRGLDINVQGENIVAVVSNWGSNSMVVLNFGNSIGNTPGPMDITSLNPSGLNGPIGVSLTKDCDNWYGLIASFNNSRVIRLSFGNDLLSSPTSDEFNAGVRPFDMNFLIEGGEFFGLSNTINGEVLRINFADSPSNTPSIDNLGSLGVLSNTFGFQVVNDGSFWYGFIINFSNRRLSRLDFPNFGIDANLFFTEEVPPLLSYPLPGDYSISLKVSNEVSGNSVQLSKPVEVLSAAAPDITFSSENICLSSPIHFTSASSTTIQSYVWDFGDASLPSPDPSPTHSYSAPGEYDVTLTVQGTNGCNNLVRNSITIYDEPSATFTLPMGVICTNQEVIISNMTSGDFGGNETWEWQVDGMTVTDTRDFNQQFSSGGMKEIKLIASIPGCSDEFVQNIMVQEGPVPSFTVDDACAGTLMEFTNTSTGTITSFNWDFDNGLTSSLENPSLEYSAPGGYNVELTVESDLGCITTEESLVTVFANPTVQFSNDLSCSQNITQFNDLSKVQDANINQWLWDFDDPSSMNNTSTIQNTTHTFTTSGDFEVKLVATSLFGCKDSTEQVVSVLASPVADFDPDRICINEPINFLDSSIPPPGGTLTSWEWDLAGQFSNEQNPTANFTVPLDYDITLFVTSDNRCLGVTTKTVSVAPTLDIVFGTEFECENEPVKFFDLTDSGADQISARTWDFGGLGQSVDSTTFFPFSEAGVYVVNLSLQTENGCEYEKEQTVTVNPAPVASFSPSATFGAPPLDVSFTNGSTGASTFEWLFEEGVNSIEINPGHTYEEFGTFEPRLIAISEELCKDTITQTISVLIPDLEIELAAFSLLDNDEQSLVLTITNNGTLTVNDLSAFVDFGGGVNVRESIDKKIMPGQTLNHTLRLAITDNSLSYICITLSNSLPGVSDSNSLNNIKCQNLNDVNPVISAPFPNPVTDFIRMNVVSNDVRSFTVQLINATGTLAKSYDMMLIPGFNEINLDIDGLNQGIYLLRIEGSERTRRIFVSR
ncbi:PKD domain-containing protein [Fulvivirga sp. M361]|uniref:PKD domain-containing protein n=1 Tax=Fulvivirga sp. M361 TaxID=2594266 RepID=UPI0016278C8C|nr:PKD domain-containing protein [Fulvivirga sp. M361]